MPRMNILNAVEREAFESPPVFNSVQRGEKKSSVHRHFDWGRFMETLYQLSWAEYMFFSLGKGNMDNFRVALDRYLAGRGPFKLELGAGENARSGWFSTDLSERQNPNGTRIHSLDVTKKFNIEDGIFDYVYCEHMIEHVPFEDGCHLLKECHRILKAGGVMRMSTPSIGFLLRVMSPDRGKFEQAYLEWSIKTCVPKAPLVTNAFFLNNFVRAWGHTFIYDRATLTFAIRAAGFTEFTECLVGSSDHIALRNLENERRLPPGFLGLGSMIFEMKK